MDAQATARRGAAGGRAARARLRAGAWSVLQATLAATIAYSFAELVLGHHQPFFAPVAAVVALSVSVGQRGRRSAEIVVGVALGLIIADLVALGLGTGPLRMGLVVALAMGAAIALGGGMLLVNQAAISALLVVTLQPPDAGFDPTRLLDAAVGAAVAFAINSLLPHDPRRFVAPAARGVYERLAETLREIAAALERGDRPAALAALGDAREVDEAAGEFREALGAATEMRAVRPLRRERSPDFGSEELAAARVDLTVADARTLARAAANAVRRGDPAPSCAVEAVAQLAVASECLAEMLEGTADPEPVRERALAAAGAAMRAIEQEPTLATGMLAGQVRMTAVDLLASSGLEHADAVERLERVTGRAVETRFGPLSRPPG